MMSGSRRELTPEERTAFEKQMRNILTNLPKFKPGEIVMTMSELENRQWVGDGDPRIPFERSRGRPSFGEAITQSTMDSRDAAIWVILQMTLYRESLGRSRVPEEVRDKFIDFAVHELRHHWPEAREATMREHIRKRRSSGMANGIEAGLAGDVNFDSAAD